MQWTMADSATPVVAAKLDRPLYRELFWPTLHAVQILGGSATRQEVLDKTVELVGYGEAEQAALMPNGASTRVNYYTGWSLTRLKRIGLLENSRRGVWAVTERGQQVCETDIPGLWEEVLEAYRQHHAERRQHGQPQGAEPGIEDEAEFNESDWKTLLLNRMKVMELSVQAVCGRGWLRCRTGFSWCHGRPRREGRDHHHWYVHAGRAG
jgi:restriction system protein